MNCAFWSYDPRHTSFLCCCVVAGKRVQRSLKFPLKGESAAYQVCVRRLHPSMRGDLLNFLLGRGQTPWCLPGYTGIFTT